MGAAEQHAGMSGSDQRGLELNHLLTCSKTLILTCRSKKKKLPR